MPNDFNFGKYFRTHFEGSAFNLQEDDQGELWSSTSASNATFPLQLGALNQLYNLRFDNQDASLYDSREFSDDQNYQNFQGFVNNTGEPSDPNQSTHSQPTSTQKTLFRETHTINNIMNRRKEEFDLIYSAATEEGYIWPLKYYLKDISEKCDAVNAEGKGKVIDQLQDHRISEFEIQLDLPKGKKQTFTVWRQLYQGEVIDICIAPSKETDPKPAIKSMRRKLAFYNSKEKPKINIKK